MTEEIVEAWRINQRVHELLIQAIDDRGMACTLSKRGGRNVVRQFAHLHNVRVMHLANRAKPLAAGARVFETQMEPDRGVLLEAMRDSCDRVEEWIRRLGAAEGGPPKGIRTFKRGLVPMVAYLIAHESHHRGNILLTLKQCGHRVDPDVQYKIWDWDRI